MYYGNTKEDAKEIGFDDSFIYKELELSPSLRRLISVPLMRDEALQAFRDWRDKTDKVEY
jgi:hypothetical protein